MFRTLIIIAAAVLLFLIIKNRLSGRSLQQKNADSTKISDDMVKCLRCGTYIPEKEAIISGTEKFCCPQHQRDWEKSHSNRD